MDNPDVDIDKPLTSKNLLFWVCGGGIDDENLPPKDANDWGDPTDIFHIYFSLLSNSELLYLIYLASLNFFLFIWVVILSKADFNLPFANLP